MRLRAQLPACLPFFNGRMCFPLSAVGFYFIAKGVFFCRPVDGSGRMGVCARVEEVRLILELRFWKINSRWRLLGLKYRGGVVYGRILNGDVEDR